MRETKLSEFEECSREYGEIEYKGKRLAFRDCPYLERIDEGDVYFVAHAIDEQDGRYFIEWDLKDCFKNEDGSLSDDAGLYRDDVLIDDWDKPRSVKKI